MSIVKSLKNIINNSDEEQKIDMWLKEYNANSEVLNDILVQESDMDFLKDYQDFSPASAWNKIESQILEDKKPQAREIPMLFKIAAAGAVLLLSIFAIKPYLSSELAGGMETYAYESKDMLNLPDGSSIIIDKGSSLEYNKLNFTDERHIAFDGRAYFDIAKSKSGKNFMIENDEFTVEILGTEFEINTITENPEVIVSEGKVRVSTDNESVIITANESVSIIDGKIVKELVESANNKSWITGQLDFENQTMDKVIEDLEHHYNVNIVAESVDFSCTWRATYENDSLQGILDELKETRGASYAINGNEVSISNISCQ